MKTLISTFIFSLTFLIAQAQVIDPNAFVTTWKTDNSGTSNNTSITIPTRPTSTLVYNYDIDWESDGIWDDLGVTGNITHDYTTAGTYQVSIRGQFPSIYFNNVKDCRKLISINQWGAIEWKSMLNSFMGCSNMGYTATDAPDLSAVTTMYRMFTFCNSFNGDFSSWDVSSVRNMGQMFWSATSFNGDLSTWDVSSVTNMGYMFWNTNSFNQDISGWDVSSVTTMAEMFRAAYSFNQNLGAWDMSSVNNIDGMFRNTGLNISNYDNTLIGWSSQNLKPNKTLRADGRKFCDAVAERQSIIDNFAWTFVADEMDIDCPNWIIASGNDNQCNSIAGKIVNGNGGWRNFINDAGEIVASIENTEDLGLVNIEYFTAPDANRMNTANANYLGRNINIEVEDQPNDPVKVRLYFLDAEYTALQNAANTFSPNSVDIDDLSITQSLLNGCSSSVAEVGLEGAELIAHSNVGTVSNGYYLEIEVSSFSEFFIHETFCYQTPSMTATAISGTTVKVEWEDHNIVEKYRLRYRPIGGSWAEVQSEYPIYFLNGLETETTYEYQLKSSCDLLNTSWTGTAHFTTGSDVCNPPVITSVDPLSDDLMKANWQAEPDAEKYKVTFKAKGTSVWTILFTTLTNATLVGITPDTEYKLKVKSKCSNGFTNWRSTTFVSPPAVAAFGTSGHTDNSMQYRNTNTVADVVVYPNPVSEIINLEFSDFIADQILIFDLTGKQVLQVDQQQSSINVSSLQNGAYFIKMQSKEGEVLVKNFIKK